MVNSSDCIRNARQCMEQAGRAGTEDVKVELLQLATAWLELEEELGRKQNLSSPSPGAPGNVTERLKECLAHAEMCQALAARSVHPRRSAKLLELAAKWVVIADNTDQAKKRA